jgi:hypothetical protein
MEVYMNGTMLATFLALSSALFGQNAIPKGTILPLQLNSTIKSEKAKPGQIVSARIMQDVPLPNGMKIKSGARVLGRVVSAEPAKNGNGTKIVLRFDTLAAGSRRIPITTNLRALAGMMEVSDAQVPQTGPDRGTTEFDWNTVQIGGEANFHGSVITSGFRTVGKSVPPTGALVQISSKQGSECRGDLESDQNFQATWVFASNACGLYGYPNLQLAHAGRTDPVGEIVLASDKGNVSLQAGSGVLLRVD